MNLTRNFGSGLLSVSNLSQKPDKALGFLICLLATIACNFAQVHEAHAVHNFNDGPNLIHIEPIGRIGCQSRKFGDCDLERLHPVARLPFPLHIKTEKRRGLQCIASPSTRLGAPFASNGEPVGEVTKSKASANLDYAYSELKPFLWAFAGLAGWWFCGICHGRLTRPTQSAQQFPQDSKHGPSDRLPLPECIARSDESGIREPGKAPVAHAERQVLAFDMARRNQRAVRASRDAHLAGRVRFQRTNGAVTPLPDLQSGPIEHSGNAPLLVPAGAAPCVLKTQRGTRFISRDIKAVNGEKVTDLLWERCRDFNGLANQDLIHNSAAGCG